jgi:hypothetical protein
MKKFTLVLLFVLMASPLFSQNDLDRIGWRKEILLSYCDEYDIMLGERGYWVAPWGVNREILKIALKRDKMVFTETDSTIDWAQNEIYTCSVKFTRDHKLSYFSYSITVDIKNGISINESIKSKLNAIYSEQSKYESVSGFSTYSWVDRKCNKPIYTMLASKFIDGNKYLITVFSSRIGE